MSENPKYFFLSLLYTMDEARAFLEEILDKAERIKSALADLGGSLPSRPGIEEKLVIAEKQASLLEEAARAALASIGDQRELGDRLIELQERAHGLHDTLALLREELAWLADNGLAEVEPPALARVEALEKAAWRIYRELEE